MGIPLGPMVLLITTWLMQGLSGIVFPQTDAVVWPNVLGGCKFWAHLATAHITTFVGHSTMRGG